MPYVDRQGRLCGFLNVEDREGSGKFVRRYFQLDPKNEKFLYYHDNPNNLQGDGNPIGEINFAVISKVSEDHKKQKQKLESCFVVNFAGRTLHLQAENDEDMKAWVQALNDSSKITVPSDKDKQLSEQESAFKTEIAGGVVCKIPIRKTSDNDTNDSSSSECSSSEEETPASSIVAWKSGFCVKQGGIRKNWKRRYFVVNETGIMYFNSEQSKDPLRHIPKGDVIGVREGQSAHSNRDNLFEVVTCKRIFFIQCDTPEEVDDWIKNIKKLLDHPDESQSEGSRSKENEDLEFPVTKVFPTANWAQEQSAAIKSRSLKGPEHKETSRESRRMKKQRSWFLW